MISRKLGARSGSWQRRLVVSLTTLAILVTTGCGGDDSPSATPTPSGSSVSASGSPSQGTTQSTSESPPAELSVTPATGTTYQRQVVSFTLPTEFTPIGDAGNGLLRQADFGAEKLQCYFSVAEFGGADITGDDIDDAAARGLKSRTESGGGQLERQADRQVGGREAYVLTGSNDISPMVYEVGAVAGSKIVTFTFGFTNDSPDNQALVESILATVTWND